MKLNQSFKKVKNVLKDTVTTEEIFNLNERYANSFIGFALLFLAIILIISYILAAIGVFNVDMGKMRLTCIIEVPLLIICFIIERIVKGKGKWLKYVLCIVALFTAAAMDSTLSIFVVLIIAYPTILSVFYYNYKFTVLIGILTMAMMLVSENLISKNGILDLNLVSLYPGTVLNVTTGELRDAVIASGYDHSSYFLNLVRGSLLPRFLLFLIIEIACVIIAKRCHSMVVNHHETVVKSSRIESELSLATDIQANILPKTFPAFPERDDFDIFATMNPAKEVGGDFYDFFMPDDKHVAIVIADVSGKGVPAALFMMTARTLIKDHIQLGLQPSEVFTKANERLCTGNEADLFVTAWMAMIDLETGKMTCANAGHNPPLLMQNGEYNWLKMRAGFVLAGMENTRYKQIEIQLNPGDKIFLYTDGATEATNTSNELYGEERLKQWMNNNKNAKSKDLLINLKADIDSFAGEAEQFDDITMLAFEFKGQAGKFTEQEFDASCDELPNVISFTEEILEKNECPIKAITAISVCLEELFVNIAHYAYPNSNGKAKIGILIKNGTVSVRLIDSGIPFNPLEKIDPDVTLSADDRNIGGLGIYMVKNMMDNVTYSYINGENTLTISKNL